MSGQFSGTINSRLSDGAKHMSREEFKQEAIKRIEKIGLRWGYAHTDVGGNTYIASLETVNGCMGQPVAEAMLHNDGRVFYSLNIRQVQA